MSDQLALFENVPVGACARWPAGLDYVAEWLTPDEEAALVDLVATLPLEPARYKGYTARRRVVGYGGRFDFDAGRLETAPELIDALEPLRGRVAAWAALPRESLVQTLVSEYAPGTPLGWHRDVPDFEEVIGVSFGGAAALRFRPVLRPSPPSAAWRAHAVRLDVAPRSIYRMRGPARWAWQHCVMPVKERRWSITFRTRRTIGAGRRPPPRDRG